jgi:molybdopterin molybdotransferase
MLSAADVQQRILERIAPLDALELSITDAHGCVLAETVTAPEDLPAHPSAATDGFAIRSSDTTNAPTTPVSLTIIGEAAAGRPFAARVTHGEAVRISSGASLPDGTDAIVHRDDVAVVGSSMAIGKTISTNNGVRPAGEDVAKGDPVMQEGQRVRGMDVGVLAALGRTRALVRPRPRAVVISVSDQLGEGGDGGPNAYAVAGMAREAGAEPTRGGSVSADAEALNEKFQSYLPQADIFLTSGGIGDDEGSVIRQVADKLGGIDLWTVSVRPEMTIGFGRVQGRALFALPDNAVAAAVAFELFVRPAILKTAGRRTLLRPEVTATMEDAYDHRPGRESYLRVRAWRDDAGWRARLAGRQGPSVISSIAGANAFAVVRADAGPPQPGDEARLILLEPLEGW